MLDLKKIKLQCLNKYITIKNDRGIIIDKTPFSEIANFDELSVGNTIEIYQEHKLTKQLNLKQTIQVPSIDEENLIQEPIPNPNPKNIVMSQTDNTAMLNLLLQQKERELSKAERQFDLIVDELRKSKEKVDALIKENIDLQTKVNTNDKDKELALMMASTNAKATLGGFMNDLKSPETLSGIAAIISAVKGDAPTNNSTESLLNGMSELKKEAVISMTNKFKSLPDESVIKLVFIMDRFGVAEIEQAYAETVSMIEAQTT